MRTIISLVLALAVSLAAQAEQFNVTGKITTLAGEPVEGVAVSDGYTVVRTDSNGYYAFNRNIQSFIVYFSLPSGYEIPLDEGSPCLYKRLTDATVYNFRLQKMRRDTDQRFNLIAMADPQCQNMHHVNRFRQETIPDVKAEVKRLKGASYGVTLGDIAYTEGPRNATYLLPVMKDAMRKEKSGIPFFQTNGNHDNIYAPVSLDARNLTPTVKYLRAFEDVFGPINYSWNRGQVHIVSMNDVIYTSVEASNKYKGDFMDEQVKWLEEDLKCIPKDRLVILCVHIPLSSIAKKPNVKRVLELLSQFENRHIISGHTHYAEQYVHKATGTPETILAAASGCWWWSNNNGDGTPNGYGVFSIEGNRITDWYYKPVGLPKSYQLRLYRGDSTFGGEYEKLTLPFGHDTILANVFSADKHWKVEIYEDGKLSGEMKKMKVSPYRGDEYPSLDSNKDWWAIGYNVGVVGRGHVGTSTRRNYCHPCKHMYIYKLRNAEAKVKVVATDSKGRQYVATEVIEGADYRLAAPKEYTEQ